MRSPEAVIPAWRDAWNRGDADAIAALFAEDAEFVNVVGLWWHSREAIRDAHAFGFRTIFPGSTITMGSPRVRRLGADAATVMCRWRVLGQVSPGGEPAGPREGVFTFVLERRAAGWVAVAAQNTDAAPGAQTHLVTGSDSAPISYGDPASG